MGALSQHALPTFDVVTNGPVEHFKKVIEVPKRPKNFKILPGLCLPVISLCPP